MKEKKTEVIAIRITASMKKKLERMASKGYRSLSQQVEMLLQNATKKK